MTETASDAAINAWTRLMHAQSLAQAAMEAALRQADLPASPWHDVLLELERSGGREMRPQVLEERLGIAQYNLSRLLDRMAQAGLLQREKVADDGRGIAIAITPAGRKMRARMWHVYAETIQHVIGTRLSEAEAGMLSSLLGWLVER